ncbi:MAG: VOC family protein [Candidatus Thorarchaeota archaeon]|nr:VOC family protein [Candidatus Thorarchaeota archaeon]
MGGILFFRTKMLDKVVSFYVDALDMSIWLDQRDCVILRRDNLLIGFCSRDAADLCGIVTLYYSTQTEVDRMYQKLKHCAEGEPKTNQKYQIYHFLARGPEGRVIEVQQFLHPVDDL